MGHHRQWMFLFTTLWASALAQRQAGDPIVAGDGGGLEDAAACAKQPLVPLNLETLLGAGSILATNYNIQSCSPSNLNSDGIGPCLFDLGFEGFELENPDEDWSCTTENLASSCSGLKCDTYHIGKLFNT